MKRKLPYILAACLLLLSLVLGLLGSAAASRQTVYFTALNDTILELREDTMPFPYNGGVYVPYSIFDPNTTGVQLGVYASYSSNIIILYGRQSGALIFDLAQDTASSSTGKKFTRRAVRHNSVIFIPVDLVVNFFGLKWSLLVDRDYGMILRVKSKAAQIPDSEFTAAGRHILESRYNAYLRSIGVTVPTASPSPTPSPSPSPRPSPSPSPRPSPSPTPSQPPAPQGGDVYLGLRCDGDGDTAPLAAALVRQGASAVFFFRPEDLLRRDAEVRALAAAGHKIGLILDADSAEGRTAQAEQGSRLLAHILRARSYLALTEDGEELPAGWLGWPAGVDGTAGGRDPQRQLRDILRGAVHPEDCFLLLDDGAQTAELAEELLAQLAEAGCTFRLGLEPVLAALTEEAE